METTLTLTWKITQTDLRNENIYQKYNTKNINFSPENIEILYIIII